jgi:hypothetical protein
VRQMEVRQRQALELNDEVVQGLAVAKLALETGEIEESEHALTQTLKAAKEIVGEMLGDAELGNFVRQKAAGTNGSDSEQRSDDRQVRKSSPTP